MDLVLDVRAPSNIEQNISNRLNIGHGILLLLERRTESVQPAGCLRCGNWLLGFQVAYGESEGVKDLPILLRKFPPFDAFELRKPFRAVRHGGGIGGGCVGWSDADRGGELRIERRVRMS